MGQISLRTGIPRSTVGYYVRKFNRLAAEGKPIVLPAEHGDTSRNSPSYELIAHAKEMLTKQTRARAMTLLSDGKYEELYYLLMDMKLIKEIESIISPEAFEKAAESIVK